MSLVAWLTNSQRLDTRSTALIRSRLPSLDGSICGRSAGATRLGLAPGTSQASRPGPGDAGSDKRLSYALQMIHGFDGHDQPSLGGAGAKGAALAESGRQETGTKRAGGDRTRPRSFDELVPPSRVISWPCR